MKENKEKRQLSVHPAIIFDLIKGQAGSLGKAVLECIMNSVDSGSSQVTVDIDSRGVNIQDNGRGFQSRKEIEDWFEVFGFPHEEGDGRIYGKFGIGRGQLWSFCSTIWRTNTFEMSVDIKKSGLDYALVEHAPDRPGLLIEGKFYQRITTSELMTFQRELTELARYCPIPVLVNGTQVNKDPAKEKWDFDTPEAWIRLKETGDLSVYNLGVFVRKFSAYHTGSGGIVVTKPGVRLALNMARNDILVSECKTWRKIKPFLQKKSDERIRTKPARLSEGELENLARRFLAEEISFKEVNERRLVTDILGRHHTLRGMIEALGYKGSGRPLTVAAEGSRLGEQAHNTKVAFVLAEKTLARFDSNSVAEFREKIREALANEGDNRWMLEALGRIEVSESVQDAAPSIKEGYVVVAAKEWSEEERIAITTIRAMAARISMHLRRHGALSHHTSQRQIELGVSDTAAAWTDGSTRIVVERRQLRLLKQGIGGFSGMANLLVHEYLHDTADTGSHTHDMEFYKRYHDATCANAGLLDQAIVYGMAAYLREIRRTKRRIPAKLAEHLSLIEDLANKPAETESTDEEQGLSIAA